VDVVNLCIYTMSSRDVVCEHGENQHPGWRCKHMHKGGGGVTRFKQHLAEKGTQVLHCRNVPPNVRDYFQCEIERTKKATLDQNRERLRKEAVAAEPRETIPMQVMMRRLNCSVPWDCMHDYHYHYGIVCTIITMTLFVCKTMILFLC
jgi:hypothetical protein